MWELIRRFFRGLFSCMERGLNDDPAAIPAPAISNPTPVSMTFNIDIHNDSPEPERRHYEAHTRVITHQRSISRSPGSSNLRGGEGEMVSMSMENLRKHGYRASSE